MHHRRRMSIHRGVLVGLVLQSFLAAPAFAQTSLPAPDVVLGVRLTVGGRYDNVRRCVATPRGTPGGPAADIQFFMEFAVSREVALTVNLPVMRPILFAAAFKLLQFEPDVTLTWRRPASDRVDWIVGPSLGLSLHYGPDYTSELDGPKFFALGPTFGGYFGLDFKQPGVFNFQLGLHPYVTPLFGVADPGGHQGVVVGAMLEGPFRFALQR